MRSDHTRSVAMAGRSSSMPSAHGYQGVLSGLSASEKRCALAIIGQRMGRSKPDDGWTDNFVKTLATLKAEEKRSNAV